MRDGRFVLPRPLNQWPLLSVLCGFVAGLILIRFGHWRLGNGLVGLSLCLGAVLRLVLPRKSVGLLLVRSKVFDVAFLLLSGLAVIVLALMINPLR